MTRREWTPRRIDAPEPGFYRMALVRGAWRVPCRILLDEQTGWWTSEVDTTTKRSIDPTDTDTFTIWHAAQTIEAWQHDYLIRLREWCAENAPDHPCLHPRRRIDPMRLSMVRVPDTLLRMTRRGDDDA